MVTYNAKQVRHEEELKHNKDTLSQKSDKTDQSPARRPKTKQGLGAFLGRGTTDDLRKHISSKTNITIQTDNYVSPRSAASVASSRKNKYQKRHGFAVREAEISPIVSDHFAMLIEPKNFSK